MKRSAPTLHQRLVNAFLWPLRAYSRWISPMFPRRCRYYPTCSAYAEQAIRTHGVVRGSILASWRIVRCNPFTKGGVDEVPPPGRWRSHDARDHASHISGSHG